MSSGGREAWRKKKIFHAARCRQAVVSGFRFSFRSECLQPDSWVESVCVVWEEPVALPHPPASQAGPHPAEERTNPCGYCVQTRCLPPCRLLTWSCTQRVRWDAADQTQRIGSGGGGLDLRQRPDRFPRRVPTKQTHTPGLVSRPLIHAASRSLLIFQGVPTGAGSTDQSGLCGAWRTRSCWASPQVLSGSEKPS